MSYTVRIIVVVFIQKWMKQNERYKEGERMNKRLLLLASCFIVCTLLFACQQKKNVLPFDKESSKEEAEKASESIDWPTLYFDEVYYQSDRFETIVEPENITVIGKVETACLEGNLPTNPSEVNDSAYIGSKIYESDIKEIIYLTYSNSNGDMVYSKWSASTSLKKDLPEDWYPSAMVNDQLYWQSDYSMKDNLPQNKGYGVAGQLLYEEGSAASKNYSNSIHMLGANIYISSLNEEIIYIGYKDGPFAELILVK